jgi:hypothetical protein
MQLFDLLSDRPDVVVGHDGVEAERYRRRAYLPYAAGPSTLASNQLAREAEVRGGEVMPFTLAIVAAPRCSTAPLVAHTRIDEWSGQ